jgi:hypothetical protein
MRSELGQFDGYQIPGDCGAGEQDPLSGDIVAGEGFDNAFGDIFSWDAVDFQAQEFDRGFGRRSDSGDVALQLADILEAIEEAADAIHARKDRPVVLAELWNGEFDGADLDQRALDHFRAERRQTIGQFGSLRPVARDDDALAE